MNTRSPEKLAFTLLLVVAAITALVSAPAFAAANGPYTFYAISPCRILDTRYTTPASPVVAGSQRNVQVRGLCGIPSAAAAATLNVTVVGPTLSGFLTLWPSNLGWPGVATLTFDAGEPALGNGAIVPLAATTVPAPDMAAIYGAESTTGTLHMVIDATGYFAP